MSFRLTWVYHPQEETASVEAHAPASFDDNQTWVAYKDGNRWHVRLDKKRIMHPGTKEPKVFDSLHSAKSGAEDLDMRLLRKRQKEAGYEPGG